MQRRALFVNRSRFGLVVQGELEAEIGQGRIFAAVDVFDAEPMRDVANILVTHPNVLHMSDM